MKTTVYPSKFGAFPAASFLSFADSLAYVKTLQDLRLNRVNFVKEPCGICTCPAQSYEMHLPDTLAALTQQKKPGYMRHN